MGYINQIKAVITEFNQLKDWFTEQKEAIRKDERYSDGYKQTLMDMRKKDCWTTQEELSSRVIKIIEDAKNEILKGKKVGARDQAFDVKLSNALELLKTIGDSMTQEELMELVEPFKQDYYTMNLLRKVFVKGDIKGIQEIFGIDNIDHNVSALDELMKSINQVFRGDIEKADTMRLSITLKMMKE